MSWTGSSRLSAVLQRGATLTPQDRHRLLMHPLVACSNDATPRGRRCAVPGGDKSPRRLDDWDERDDVIGFETCLHDEVDAAGRQQAVAVAIATVARHEHARFEGAEPNGLFARGKEIGVGRAEDRVGKPGAGACAQALLPPVRPAPARATAVGPEPLCGERLIHQTESGSASIHETDQRSPQWRSHDKRPRAVDWIYHPVIAALPGNVAVFLPNDAVIGVTGEDGFADDPFGGPVRCGDGIERRSSALVCDGQGLA